MGMLAKLFFCKHALAVFSLKKDYPSQREYLTDGQSVSMLKYDSVHFGLMKNPSDFIHLALVVQTLLSIPGNSNL